MKNWNHFVAIISLASLAEDWVVISEKHWQSAMILMEEVVCDERERKIQISTVGWRLNERVERRREEWKE